MRRSPAVPGGRRRRGYGARPAAGGRPGKRPVPGLTVLRQAGPDPCPFYKHGALLMGLMHSGGVEKLGMESQLSKARLPPVDDRQLLEPLKLNDWFRDRRPLANSVSSLMTACRAATRPTMMPSTMIVARNTHSTASRAPLSSCQSLCK